MAVIKYGDSVYNDVSKLIVWCYKDRFVYYPINCYDKPLGGVEIRHKGKVRFEFNAKSDKVRNISNFAVRTLNSYWRCVVHGDCNKIETNGGCIVGGKIKSTSSEVIVASDIKLGSGKQNPFYNCKSVEGRSVVLHVDGYMQQVDIINGDCSDLSWLDVEIVVNGDVDGCVQSKHSVVVDKDAGFVTAKTVYVRGKQ